MRSWQADRRDVASAGGQPLQSSLLVLAILTLGVGLSGCKRPFYKRTADRDAYCIIGEKGSGRNWRIKPGFHVEPDPRSRFYDATCQVDPRLPAPDPQLYSYTLPPLSTPEPPERQLEDDAEEANAESNIDPTQVDDPGEHPTPPPPALDAAGESLELSGPDGISSRDRSSRTRVQSLAPPPDSVPQAKVRLASSTTESQGVVAAVGEFELDPVDTDVDVEESSDAPVQSEGEVEEVPAEPVPSEFGQTLDFRIPPVPIEAWEAIPASCLRRMLEFESIRDEYQGTFRQAVEESQLDPAQRVSLENILEIALINSRDFQTRKESLYRTALALTLQRFDYQLRFLRRGNGISTNYTHDRNAGIEVNTLGIPSGIGVTRSLYTAGELVARFANDVVLTFNGASGFSKSIGSEVLLDLTQPLLQRDVRFEPLTQAERDVVYAARDFVQFRKQLFRDLAVQYYGLLLSYRSIAINTQDYFSNLQGFNRSRALYQAERIPRFQVDQFEQNVLRSRGNLIDACNSLEGALDRLKLRIGLPPEMPLNVDLSELESLTRSDEATVIREQIRRTRNYVVQALEGTEVTVAIPQAAELARRMQNLSLVNASLGVSEESEVDELQVLIALLEAQDKRLEATKGEQVLALAKKNEFTPPAQIYLRQEAVTQAYLEAVQKEFELLGATASTV